MNPCPCGHLGNAAARVPLHARCGRCATRAGSAGRCSTASTCRSRCLRSPPSASRRPPTASRAHSSALASSERAGARSSAREWSTARLRRRARPSLPARSGDRELPQAGDDATRRLGARLSPRPAGRAHDRRPRGQRRGADGARRRGDPVPTRTGAGRRARSAAEPDRGVGAGSARLQEAEVAREVLQVREDGVEVGVADAEPAAERAADGVDRGHRQVGVVGRVLVVVEAEDREAAVDLAAA